MQRGIDFIGVGVGAAIINKKGEILITQRGAKAKNERWKWEIPGGGVEFNETLRDAIKREILEELGVEIEVYELLDIADHIIPDEQQHWVSPTYICTIKKGIPQIKEPEKCAAWGWFSLQNAAKLDLSIITTHDIAILKKKRLSFLTKYGSKSII